MISVKRLADASGKHFYLVESRLPDGTLQCVTRSCRFRCNSRGFDDRDARSKALRFAITTDTLPYFRAFIFNEVDGTATTGRNDGAKLILPSRSDVHLPVGSSQDGSTRRISSYVCMRQNRLTGVRFVVAMSRLDSGRLRAISFQDHSLAGGNSDEALNKAVRFLRGVAFESWRKQAMNELTSRDRDGVGSRRERALKHTSAFVEIEAGEKVDCACGKNRSRGLMVACERCGAWEHAECQGFRSDKQIPADYICSACMRAEREDVVVIRLDEQGECGNLQLDDLWTETKVRDSEADDGVCCVCGCEDNQDFENMILPENEHACNEGAALAHPSCISAAQHLSHKAWNGKAMAAGICQICGDRFNKSPKGNEDVYSHTSSGVSQSKSKKGSVSPNQSHTRNSRRAAKVDQSARGAKRLRSALTNGVVTKQEIVDKLPDKNVKVGESEVQATQSGQKMETASPEAKKSSVPQVGTTLPDRRFNDAAVTVPIKKRRLMMMMEAVRSPSPPLSPPPPPQVHVLVAKTEDLEQKDVKGVGAEVVQALQDAEMVEVGSGEHVSAETRVGSPNGRFGSSEPSKKLAVNKEPLRKIESQFDEGSDVSEMEGSQETSVPDKNHISAPSAPESSFQEKHAAELVIRSDGLATQGSSQTKTSADGNTHNGKDESDNLSDHGAQHGASIQVGDGENKDAGATSSASQSRSRDVRLHWDLNMDMEEWERPPEEDTGTFSGVQQGTLSASPLNDVDDADDHKVAEDDHIPSEQVNTQPAGDDVQVGNDNSDTNREDAETEREGTAEGDASSTDAGSVESKHHVEIEELNSATKESSVEDYSDALEAEHVDYDDSESRQGDEGASDAEEKVESQWREKIATGSPGQTDRAEEGGSDVGMKDGPVDERTEQGDSGDHRDRGLLEGAEAENTDADSEAGGSKNIVIPEPGLELRESHNVRELEMQELEIQEGIELQEGIEIQDGIEIQEGIEINEGIEIQEGKDNLPTQAAETHSSERIESVVVREDTKVQEEDKEASTPGSSARRADGQSRAKSSGWDQLPEGFDKAEDALRAAKDSPVGRGRGATWATANGRGASISPRGGPATTRFGRGIRADGVGEKARSEDSWTREDHQRVQRVDDNVDIPPRVASPRELGRGRSHGRGGSPALRGRGRMEPWMESPTGPSSPWGGPTRHPSPPGGHFSDGFGPRGPANAATRAALKVESSGFVVAPDGTLTKAGGSSGRGPPRPFQSGGRNGRGAMFNNMGRGGPGMNLGLGMNLGGLRGNMGMGRGMGMGPGMGLNIGMGIGMGMGVGPGVGLGMPGRGGPGGRGMVDRYSGPYAGRGSAGGQVGEHSSSSRRGRFNNDYDENWPRRDDRSSSPRKRRSTPRRSRSGTPSRSKSRTRSPRARTPPRPANSSGSGGGVLSKGSKKRSHSPSVHKVDVRGDRQESPPARRSVPPPPKLPLPPPPPRSQRSPPAGLRRLTESKRDADRGRSRDRERERERDRERPSSTRARTPPRRTSPHVVHGSALMDERDRQLLAGIRHVSPVNVRNRSAEAPGAAAVTSSRDSPPLPSPAGRLAEGSSEARRLSGEEGVDSRVHGFKRDDMGIKAEQRSSKESSRGERERIVRRESGRDRDEERRDASKSSYSGRDRDGRSSSSMKYNRDVDDDVAPRRRRPSP